MNRLKSLTKINVPIFVSTILFKNFPAYLLDKNLSI